MCIRDRIYAKRLGRRWLWSRILGIDRAQRCSADIGPVPRQGQICLLYTSTIKLLHTEVPGVKIIVGGAVLTPEYAKQIGADYYAKDAAESARIAEEVFGQ